MTTYPFAVRPRRPVWHRRALTLWLSGLFAALLMLLPAGSRAEPAGNNPPTNVACQGWERDTVIISWKDNDNDEANYRVERSIDGAAFAEIATVAPDANGNYPGHRDMAIDVTKNYRYRVRGAHGDGSFTNYGPVCDNRRITETTGFRIFYGVDGTDDCPPIDGQRVCLTNTNAGGNNVFVTLQTNALEGSADAFQRVGFDRDAAVPSGGLDRIPVNVVWCDGGGCAGGNSLGLSPFLMEMPFNLTTRAGDPIAYLVSEHEVFHFQQFKYWGLNDPDSGWVVEGQARSSQDKICIGADRATALCFDDVATGYAGYVPQVNGYLSNPATPVNRASYSAALFWTYVTEKFGASAPGDTVEGGMNLMAEFWKQSATTPNRDGIAVLNSALQVLGHSARFRDIWKDFAVANFAKNLSGAPVPAKYKYADMAQTGGAYNEVAATLNEALSLNEQILRGVETIYPWAARYYILRPDADVPVVDVRVNQDSNVPLYYTVLGIRDAGIQHEYNYEGRHLNHTVLNNNYDRVVVVVAGLDNLANYRVSINGTQPTLNLLTPTTANKARVGDPAAPDKFRVAVEVLAADATPLSGVDLASFNFRVGSQQVPAANILTSAQVLGQQWFVLRAPTQTVASQYDLRVDYAGSATLVDTETLAVDYTPRTDADSMLVIDRSGSMGDFGGAPLQAAKNAARLYVDSWRTGDALGIVSFSTNPTLDMLLTPWTDTPAGGSRQQAFNTIDAFIASGGTNIGDSLMMGFNELNTRGNAAHDWALVLLSDGKEEASSPTVPLDQAITNIATATGKRPVIHAIAIGAGADGPKMQNAAVRTGGTYQFVSAPTSALAAGAGPIANPRLDLDARYRYIATEIVGQQQFFTLVGPLNDNDAFQDVVTIPVEGSVAELVVSLSFDGGCGCDISLREPGGGLIALFEGTSRHRIWRVATPAPGNWTLTIAVSVPGLATDAQPSGQDFLPPYLVQSAVRSDVTLDVDFPLPVAERTAGVPMPIIAGLTDAGPILGATVVATVTAPSGVLHPLTLHDDGAHADGAAGDGLYGNTFYQTGMAGSDSGAGSYNVTVNATGVSPLAGAFTRQKILAFFIYSQGDADGDDLPDEYEDHYGGGPTVLDPNEDVDNDGRTTREEWQDGTNPTDPDTDDGGEKDGSEHNRGSNPFDPTDDGVEPTWTVAYPGISKVFVRYAPRAAYALVQIYKSDTLTGTFSFLGEDLAVSGMVTDTAVVNDQQACYYAIGITPAGAQSAPLAPSCATPKADPWPPDGGVLINGGASVTASPDVVLTLIATDEVSPHLDTPDAFDDLMLPPASSASGVTEMRISHNGDMSDGVWEPFVETKPWTLAQTAGLAAVYVQYRDAAGNESRIIPANILVDEGASPYQILLPIVINE